MKKLIKTCILLSCLGFIPLASCGENNNPDSGDEYDENKKNFDGVIFENKEVEYDGNYHSIVPLNLPPNTQVTYTTMNSFVEVGRYEIEVIIEKEGYNRKTLKAILRISEPSIKGLTVPEKLEVPYDGNDHYEDIKIVGTIPEGAEVEKFVKFNENTVTEAIEPGTYKFHFRVIKEGQSTLDLYSKLIISGKDFGDEVWLSKEHLDVKYDGLDHKNDVKVQYLPTHNDAKITGPIVKNSNDKIVKEAKDIGEYTLEFKVEKENYATKTLVATLSIFDGKNLKNGKNNIQVSPKDTGLVFYDLHDNGHLNLLANKESKPSILTNEKVLDYKLCGPVLFIKTADSKIKWVNLNESNLQFKEFQDSNANMDFEFLNGKHIIYTRREDSGKISVCRVSKENDEIQVLYTGDNVSNIRINQNKIYFLENISTINNTIKYFAYNDQTTIFTPTILNENLKNLVNFKIENDSIYYLSNPESLTKFKYSINSYNLFGDSHVSKTLVEIGDSIADIPTIRSIEYDIGKDINGTYLFYKFNRATTLTESVTVGIFKNKIGLDVPDIKLLDTSKLNMNINSITYFDDLIYFGNETPKDCHLYSIPSFGVSTSPTLVK